MSKDSPIDNRERLQYYADEIDKNKQKKEIEKSTTILNEFINNKPTRQIHATMFKTYFADYFDDKFNNKKIDPELDQAKFKQWMYIAKGPYGEVELLDSKNNVVDVVPSFFIQSGIDPIKEIDNLIGEFDLYDKKKNNHKQSAEERLRYKVETVDINETTSLQAKEHYNKWITVINKYKNKLNMDTDNVSKEDIDKIPKKVKEKLNITNDISDDIEY